MVDFKLDKLKKPKNLLIAGEIVSTQYFLVEVSLLNSHKGMFWDVLQNLQLFMSMFSGLYVLMFCDYQRLEIPGR